MRLLLRVLGVDLVPASLLLLLLQDVAVLSLAEGGSHLDPVKAAVTGGVIALVPLIICLTAVVPSKDLLLIMSRKLRCTIIFTWHSFYLSA